jgi:solute carrier family 31 (copper transporter), member 1
MSMDSSATMASMTGMDMPSATASMSGMDHGTMGMSEMSMTFFSSTNTPLWSNAWRPNSTGQYAGTCIFLIVLATVFRGLIALRCNFPDLWLAFTRRQQTAILRREFEAEHLKRGRRPWRINEAAARAVLDTILAGVGVAVMLEAQASANTPADKLPPHAGGYDDECRFLLVDIGWHVFR